VFRTFLSWRYLFARRTNLIGIVGILVGVGALILILSSMTGFLEESRRTVRGSLSDVLVQPFQEGYAPGGGVPASAQPLLRAVRADPRVAGATAQLLYGGIITQRDRGYERILSSQSHGSLLAVQLVGVDVANAFRLSAPLFAAALAQVGGPSPARRVQDEYDATDFFAGLTSGNRSEAVASPLFPFLPPPGYAPLGRPKKAVVVGQQLFEALRLSVGDEIQIATAVADPDGGDFRVNNREFVVAGCFRSGENEADLSRIYLDRRELADFMGDSRTYTQVLVRLHDYEREGRRVCADLRERLDDAGLIAGGLNALTEVRTWEEFRGNLLGAIENERVLMGIMLSLVLIVAGFTIFAILSMMVTEKRRDIGILSALGATPRGVLQLFLMIALWDALLGASLGALLGTWAAIEIDPVERWLSETFGIQIFNRNVYLFDHIPSIVQPFAVALIVLGAFTCALLFAAIPAWRAARLHPLDALRYE